MSKVVVELSSVWLPILVILGSHWRVAGYINKFGTDQQKKKYLPQLASGRLIACHANNERNGKTMEAFDTLLTKNSDRTWTLSGSKEWVSHAKEADFYAITARVADPHGEINSAVVLLERGHPGLSIGDNWSTMGLRGMSLAPVILKNCHVESENILGEFKTNGKIIVDSARNSTSLNYASRAYGASRSVIESCCKYLMVTERNHVIGSLAAEPVVRMRLGVLMTKFYSIRAVLEKTTEDFLAGRATNDEISAAKIYCTETALKIAKGAQLLYGGAGYTNQQDIERMVRDITSLVIIGAPNDTLLDRLGTNVLKSLPPQNQTPSAKAKM